MEKKSKELKLFLCFFLSLTIFFLFFLCSFPSQPFLPPLFSLIYTLFFPSYPSRSLAFLFSPPPSVCYKWESGREYVGFSHSLAGADPTPHPLIFCFSLHSLCLMSEGSLEENHPYSNSKFSGCLLELYSARCSTDINSVLLWRQNRKKKISALKLGMK